VGYWTVQEFPKTTLRLLEGLMKLRKAVITVSVYYSERIPVKISEGRRYIEQSPGGTKCGASSCPSSQRSCVDSAGFFQQGYVGTHMGYYHPEKLTLAWCPGFTLGACRASMTGCLHG